MSEVKVISNYHPRDLLYFHELDDKQQNFVKSEYDWIKDLDNHQFFIYKDWIYILDDFMAVHNKVHNPNPPDWLLPWDGYMNDSFFSGIVIKMVDDYNEQIIIGWFYS